MLVHLTPEKALKLKQAATELFNCKNSLMRDVVKVLGLIVSSFLGVACGPLHYLNNRVFLSRNYRLIVAPRKFDVLKTKRSKVSRANMLVLRTSNFQGATIRPIVPRHKHSIVFIVHH